MADANNRSVNNSEFKEAVCIDAGKIFDSCCDRDCLEDLRVYFCREGQNLIENAVSVKVRSAEVADVKIDVEPVNLSRGFYSCDITFFFIVLLDVYSSPCSCPTEVRGIAIFNKKVVLCGGEGNVRSFTSETACGECADFCAGRGASVPKCVVQVATPIALSSRIGNGCGCHDNVGVIPAYLSDYLGGCVIADNNESPVVYVTLGVFTIVQLIRNVQVLVPVYDFCIPEKQCENTTDSPCEVFRRIEFPTDDFFPSGSCASNCGCSCGEIGD